MAVPEDQRPAPKFEFIGDTEDERIANAQWFQIGVGIMQRHGQDFTPDEKIFMNIAFAQFARPVDEKGARSVARPQQAQQQQPEQPAARPSAKQR